MNAKTCRVQENTLDVLGFSFSDMSPCFWLIQQQSYVRQTMAKSQVMWKMYSIYIAQYIYCLAHYNIDLKTKMWLYFKSTAKGVSGS